MKIEGCAWVSSSKRACSSGSIEERLMKSSLAFGYFFLRTLISPHRVVPTD